MKSYKFRIFPNRQQVQILSQTIETCRSLYNQSLEERLKDKGLKYYEQKRNLTQKRKVIASLKRAHSQVLQNVVWRLERAFQNYHRDRKIGQPKFKRHGRYNSITYPQYGSFCIKENTLKLAFVDGLIKLKLHRRFVAEKIKTCTIVRDIDRWFACFSCNNDIQKSSSSDIVGVDVGLLNWMMLSNGEIIDRPRFLGASTERVRRLQRSLSRKKKGSRNREKTRIQLAKSWRKVRLQRDDYCQKITTSLAKRFGKIVFEKLSIDKMVKNRNLAQSILDSTWYRIRQLAACKAEVIIVDPSNTTQRCSCCGSMPEKKIDLKVRVYKCSSCGLVLNRDHNAALEILRKGLEQTHMEKLPLLDKTSKLFRGSMKPISSMSG